MPLDDPGSATDLLPAPDVLFSLELLGATVSCRITRPALERWKQEHRLDHAAVPTIRRVAWEIVEPLLRDARVQPHERWIACFGDGSVALMIDEQ